MVILQSLVSPATTKATPQLTWSAPKPAPQERQGSQLQREMFSKIFHQIQKAGRKKAIEGTKLSQRYLVNWSESGRQLSPFLPLVSLELGRFANGKVGKEGKSPALIQWGKLRLLKKGSTKSKVWKKFGRVQLDELRLRLMKKKIYSKELKNVAKPKKTEGKKCKKVLDKYIPFTWHERLFTFKGRGMR